MKLNNQINKLEYSTKHLTFLLQPRNAFAQCNLCNVLLTQSRETLKVVDLFFLLLQNPFCEIQVENHRMMTGVCNSTRQIFTSRSHSIRGLCSSSGPGPGSFIKGPAKSQRTAASFAAECRLVSAVSSR